MSEKIDDGVSKLSKHCRQLFRNPLLLSIVGKEGGGSQWESEKKGAGRADLCAWEGGSCRMHVNSVESLFCVRECSRQIGRNMHVFAT